MVAVRTKKKTLADMMVIAISPTLIMLLVGSFVFFLLTVCYEGQYTGRLRYIFALFIFAAVLIGRISIEEGTEHATLFAIPLAIATALALGKFVRFDGASAGSATLINWSVMALIWWLAHKLTWDCTVIDDQQDASGEGILQHMGLEAESDDEASSSGSATEEMSGTESPQEGKMQNAGGWWQRLVDKRRQAHTPGVWVILFSICALPVFGIGQWWIPSDNDVARRFAFNMLCLFVASALGLLLTTSFLGLRRYLRQRNLEMPLDMAGVWLAAGVCLIVVTLGACVLLPRPGAALSISQLPFHFGSPDHDKTQKFAFGNDGPQKQDAGRTRSDLKQGQGKPSSQNGSTGKSSSSGSSKGNSSSGRKGEKSASSGRSQQKGETSSQTGKSSSDRNANKGRQSSNAQSQSPSGSNSGKSKGDQESSSSKNGSSRTSSSSGTKGSDQGGKSKGSQSKNGAQRNSRTGSPDQQAQPSRTGTGKSEENRKSPTREDEHPEKRASDGSSRQQDTKGDQSDQDSDPKTDPNTKNDSKADGSSRTSENRGSGKQPVSKGAASKNNSNGPKFSQSQSKGKRTQSAEKPSSSRESTGASGSSNFSPTGILQSIGTGFAYLVKLTFFLCLVGFVGFLLWKYRNQVREALAQLVADLRRFLDQLFGRRETEAESSAEDGLAESGPTVRPFSSYHDPFLSGAAKRSGREKLVRYTFEAMEAWARERHKGRTEEQTPLEFAQELGREYPTMGPDVQSLADLYSRVAYGRQKIRESCEDDLRHLWHCLSTADPPQRVKG